MSKYNLFLDDERMPKDVKWVELPLVAWVIVRNYKDFVRTIEQNGVPALVTFDHDLAEEHYKEHHVAHDEKMLSQGTIRYDRFKEKTGFDCAKWLANYCLDNCIDIPPYYTHTMNGIGAENIKSVLESAKKILPLRKELKSMPQLPHPNDKEAMKNYKNDLDEWAKKSGLK